MAKYTELMLQYSDNELTTEQSIMVEKELSENSLLKQEYALNLDIDKCMRGHAIANQAFADIELPQVEKKAKNDIAEHLMDKSGSNHGLEFFIKGALIENDRLERQIDEAEREMISSGVERKAFDWVNSWIQQKEQLLKNDPSTKQILDFVKQGMQSDYEPKQRSLAFKSTKKLLYKIASVAAIFLVSFSLWMLFSAKESPDELFAEYYQPYQVIDGQTRSNTADANKLFKNAVKSYKKGDFKASALDFDNLLKLDNSSPKMRLLFSITQIELQNYQEAIVGFTNIINANGDYVVEAKWYLSMSYLKTGEINKAKTLLEELAVTPGYYKNKAVELLDEL
jgi:tetratricopeptide (TPR) repeat protein